MQLVLLLTCFVWCSLGINTNFRQWEKTTFSNLHSRHKRQASAICIRNETYSCTRTITEQYQGFCPFFTTFIFCTRTREREVTDTCTRQVAECCEGYILQNGRCILDTTQSPQQSACTPEPTDITTASGTLSSPNFPQVYPSDANCSWIVRAPVGVEIRVQISTLQLAHARRQCSFRGCFFVCLGDRLTISGGTQTWTLCGSESALPIYTSTRGRVQIQFQSSQNVVHRGFHLTYNILLPSTTSSMTTTTIPSISSSSTSSSTYVFTTASSTTTTPTPPVTMNSTQPFATIITPSTSSQSLPTISSTSVSTTTVNDSRNQYLKVCAPYCSQRCENGSVVNVTCQPEWAGRCRPACACPSDRPVLYGSSCLTASLCAATYRPSPTCHGGMVSTTCLRTCSATCENQTLSANDCPYPPLEQCVSGCMCPPHIPINHLGHCIVRELCPRPEPPAITCGNQFYQPSVRITGGSTAIQGSWPWAAQIIRVLLKEETFQCGGTIICNNWILTAAHCFQDETNPFVLVTEPALYRIRIGKHNRSEEIGDHVVIQVPLQILLHPLYNSETTTNDIALVRLGQALQFNDRVRPACMPEYVRPAVTTRWGPPDGALCYAIGWGETLGRGPSNMFLKQVALPIRTPHSCTRLYNHFNQSIAYCVGGRSTEDTCTGDSGGPLLCRHGTRWYVDGITSYGLECGTIGLPSVYTRVTAYSNWVRQITGNSCGHPDTRWAQTNN